MFEDLLYQNVRQVGASTSQDTQAPSGVHLGTGVRVVATEKIYTQGSLHADRQLRSTWPSKAAASSRSRCPTARIGYTRDGSFQLSAQGQMVTSSGYSRAAGHHAFPTARRASPSAATASSPCASPARATPMQVGTAAAHRLRESRRPAAARREPAGRIRRQRPGADRHARPERPRPGRAGLGRSSNVNVVEELVNMIETQRAYEMNSKAISTDRPDARVRDEPA